MADIYVYRLYERMNTERGKDFDARICFYGNYISVFIEIPWGYLLYSIVLPLSFVFFFHCYLYITSIVYAFRLNSGLLWNRGNINSEQTERNSIPVVLRLETSNQTTDLLLNTGCHWRLLLTPCGIILSEISSVRANTFEIFRIKKFSN